MLSTSELKEYVTNEVNSKIEGVSWDFIRFEDGKTIVPGGYNFYYKDGMYHGMGFGDRGAIVEEFVTDKKEYILERVVQTVAFSVAWNYTYHNHIVGEDNRRITFQKELEIYSRFGQEFYEKKKAEIEEILSRNPYNDNTQ
ncbi:MAG: immunity 63 family protein [Lachnospiraceae bacterium]|nr:immunity 63 family protein [Lachnospiraceae bacterium]